MDKIRYKMDKKYYTPTIEEFHVGFEYEVKGLKKWDKKIVSSSQDILEMEELMMRSLNPYRVKYLDREDIESLGFSKIKMKDESKLSCCNDHDIFKKDLTGFDEYLEVVYFENYAGVSLHHLFPGEAELNNDNKIFFMKIKNKSELKKLLKQLNINDNN